MDVFEVSILHHVCIVLLLLWLLTSFNCCHPIAYFVSLIYLCLVHKGYVTRLRRKIQFEESRNSNRRRVLSDSETVRWLNYAMDKIWPVCMEQIVSQKVLLPIVPWFLQKYKPWTVKEAVVQHLYMGRSPPMFTEMRVLHKPTGDDHLVLELGMNFRTADDMNAILAMKLTRRLGFGMWAKLHLLGMHVEGKVLVGVKFLRHWPFLGRLRVCFVEPPYFQMTVKPIFTHGIDVTELPGIAGYVDNLLAIVFEQTLVEPNMLVVDMEKFVAPQPESWFSVDAKEPVAYAFVEVIEAADMKPSDLNGLADPYVKGQLGPYRFRTMTQKKTLAPKWGEEFKVPVFTWESPNVLAIEVHDKDHFVDDALGDCSIKIVELRDGQRHDMWLPLQNIKMGRLHLAITVVEGDRKAPDQSFDIGTPNDNIENISLANDNGIPGMTPKVADIFEPIDIEGQEETGIWVHHPGSEVPQVWEPRKGKSKLVSAPILITGSFKSTATGSNPDDGSSSDESEEGNDKGNRPNKVQRGLNKIGSLFQRNSKKEGASNRTEEELLPSPHANANLKAVNEKEIGVNLILDDNLSVLSPVENSRAEGKDTRERPKGSDQESPRIKSTAPGSNRDDGSSNDESEEGNDKGNQPNKVQRGLNKIGSLFQRNSKKEGASNRTEEELLPSPHANANLKAVNEKEIGGNFILDDNLSVLSPIENARAEGKDTKESPKGSDQESPRKGHVKDTAKSILKHTLSRKGSKKPLVSSETVETEGGIPVGSESSDEGVVPSPACDSGVEGIPVVSKPLSSSGGDSFISEEVNNGDPKKKVCVERPQKIVEEDDDLLVKESSSPRKFDEYSEVGKKEVSFV
ncbi:C2 domain-containing protein At1g53590-like isoform X2 [Rhododendron vialii]|uniref:C2 domain-containing protein At1g53590-like isoform X2 n=1 Tax=Rhododendron vialii TaxID=182163 RepID=UPI002660497F|nr:C2 domain-containing protein At1g53590-like isoform X2 [Rhododendron vialii]